MPAGAHSTNSGGARKRCPPMRSTITPGFDPHQLAPGVAVRLEFGARVELLAAELHRLRRRDQRLGEMADFWHGFVP